MNDENPRHLKFWLGQVDPRPLALFRIFFGLVVLQDLFVYACHLTTFASDAGMLPRGVQGELRAWSLFNLVGSPAAVAVLFALGVLAVISFTAGYRTRVAAAIAWLFLTSLDNRNLYVTDGGDDLVRILFFLSMFTEPGGIWSVDVALGRRKIGPVPALGLRALQLHIALLYFVAGRLKFRNGWLSHDNIFTTLQLDGFVRPLGKLLGRFPTICRLLGISTMSMEWSYAFFAFSPWAIPWMRAAAIACGFLVQFGILATMRVGVFTGAMLSTLCLMIQPQWLDALAAWWRKRSKSKRPILQLDAADQNLTKKIGNLQIAAALFLAVHFLALAWGPFVGGRFKIPAPLRIELTWLWLDQPFGLFDVTYSIPHWQVSGVRADGAAVDVLAAAEPGLVPTPGWSFTRWYKFLFKERERPFHYPELEQWLCRRYRDETGSALRSATLTETFYAPLLPGEVAGAPVRRVQLDWQCAP